MQLCINGTVNLCACCLLHCVSHFAGCSSFAVTLQLGNGWLETNVKVTACPNQKTQVHDCGNAALPGRLCLVLAAQ